MLAFPLPNSNKYIFGRLSVQALAKLLSQSHLSLLWVYLKTMRLLEPIPATTTVSSLFLMLNKPDTCHGFSWNEKCYLILFYIAKNSVTSLSRIAWTHRILISLLLSDEDRVFCRSYCIILSLSKPFKNVLFLTSSEFIYLHLGYLQALFEERREERVEDYINMRCISGKG